jgi:hypothetical protein
MNETFSVTPGGFVDSYQPHGFSYVYGIWVDNFSGGWLQINQGGLWVPPYTRGWKATVFPGTTTVTVRSYDFANGVRIAGATGQAAQVTLWDAPNGDSEGIDFFDQQTIPIVNYFGGQFVNAGFTNMLPAPTVGRIRLYDARMSYAPSLNTVSSSITGNLVATNHVTNVGSLTISPANPESILTIVSPGGDLPIGQGLDMLLNYIDNGATDNPNIVFAYRYAVI